MTVYMCIQNVTPEVNETFILKEDFKVPWLLLSLKKFFWLLKKKVYYIKNI